MSACGSAIKGCKLYLMNLTSTFTTLLPRDCWDTEEMTHTNTQAWKHLRVHIFIWHTRPDTPALQHIHLTLVFVFKIQLPTYWYFTGIFKMQTRAVISQGSHWFLFMSQPRRPTPPPLPPPMHFRLADTHTHRHTKTNTSSLPQPRPQPTPVQEVSLLIGNQSKIIH